jgi:hypothetical protein
MIVLFKCSQRDCVIYGSFREYVWIPWAMTSEEAPSMDSADDDKPNITVGDDHEVHLHVSERGASDEGSILAAPAQDLPIDAEKDPNISHVPDTKISTEGESKCCLLL